MINLFLIDRTNFCFAENPNDVQAWAARAKRHSRPNQYDDKHSLTWHSIRQHHQQLGVDQQQQHLTWLFENRSSLKKIATLALDILISGYECSSQRVPTNRFLPDYAVENFAECCEIFKKGIFSFVIGHLEKQNQILRNAMHFGAFECSKLLFNV